MLVQKRQYHIIIAISALILFFALFTSQPAFAALHPDDTEAVALKELNIFLGTENGFALDEKPTRVEAAVILLRILGREPEALAENLPNNFDDVPVWADAQIGYLYQKGLVKGMSDTHFGNEAIDFNQMMTMILRAMGYDDGAGDFVWSSAAEKAKALSVLTPRRYDEIMAEDHFTRKNLVSCVFYALQAPVKNSDKTLIKQLLDDSVLTEEQVKATGIADLMIAAGLLKRESEHCYLHQEFTFSPSGDDANFILTVNLPDNYLNRQKVISHTFSSPPTMYHYDEGNLYALFYMDDIDLKKPMEIDIVTELEISRYDLETAEKFHFPTVLSEEDRVKYTSATEWIESDNPLFQDVVLNSADGTTLQKVEEITDYVLKHMKIETVDEDVSALTALQRGGGDCSDYSMVFAALCRAHGIPARDIVCDCVDESATGHAIVEVFFDDLGWVPIDPVNIESGAVTLEKLNSDFVYLTNNSNSSFLYGDNYYCSYGNNVSLSVNEYFEEQ